MVVDTMVFAYALLARPSQRDEALDVLGACDELLVPDSVRPELANTVWQYVRHKDVPVQAGIELLRSSEALFERVVSSRVLWERALILASAHDHPAYDTLFIALAEMNSTRVVTYDERLRRVFPATTIGPKDLLEGRPR